MDCLLVILMSFDTLLACIACGAQGIRPEAHAASVIAGIGCGCLALSFLLSRILLLLLPVGVFHFISCGALLLIALACLFEEGCKRLTERLTRCCDPYEFRLHGLCFVLRIYAESSRADADRSGTLSVREAALLALPLSLDSLLTGLSISAAPLKALFLLALSFGCGLAAAKVGARIGLELGHAAGRSASLISGCLLLIIALVKFIL